MIISRKHKFIFFANGKTGTSSIEKNLNQYQEGEEYDFAVPGLFSKKHIPPVFVKSCMTDSEWENYFKFVFVRNPWDWFVSQWKYNFSLNETPKIPLSRYFIHPRSSMQMKKNNDSIVEIGSKSVYNAYDVTHLANYLKRFRALPGQHTLIQSTKVFDLNGKQMVDYIGRFENLENDYQTILKQIGLPIQKLPHVNSTKHQSYKEHFTECGIEKVAEIWEEDIRSFGYTY
jgi:hypothetical protein